MNAISLSWKSYSVKVDKIKEALKILLSSNYDGLICDAECIHVIFKNDISSDDEAATNSYWASITPSTFQTTLAEVISGKINDAVLFGNALVINTAIENVAMGITQAGKTKDVSDYCRNVARYLREGSLYAAMGEIDTMIMQVPSSDLAPFITIDRLNACKAKIATFLGL